MSRGCALPTQRRDAVQLSQMAVMFSRTGYEGFPEKQIVLQYTNDALQMRMSRFRVSVKFALDWKCFGIIPEGLDSAIVFYRSAIRRKAPTHFLANFISVANLQIYWDAQMPTPMPNGHHGPRKEAFEELRWKEDLSCSSSEVLLTFMHSISAYFPFIYVITEQPVDDLSNLQVSYVYTSWELFREDTSGLGRSFHFKVNKTFMSPILTYPWLTSYIQWILTAPSTRLFIFLSQTLVASWIPCI